MMMNPHGAPAKPTAGEVKAQAVPAAAAQTAAASEAPPTDAATLARSRTLRWLLWAAGTVALGLGLLGAVLPVLPATPFILLAAACYAKASPRLHQRMRQNAWIGAMVRDWEAHRSLTLRVKTVALLTMTLMLGASAWMLQARPVLLWMLLAGALLGIWMVGWLIPTRAPGARGDRAP